MLSSVVVWKMKSYWPCALDFWTPKPNHFYDIPRSFHTPSLTLWDHSFLSYAADIQTNKQKNRDKHTNRQSQTCYPRRPTESVWVQSIWLMFLSQLQSTIADQACARQSSSSNNYILPRLQSRLGERAFSYAGPLSYLNFQETFKDILI